MQVVSGRENAPIVHFEGPPAARIPAEVDAFLEWFNAPPKQDGILLSAIAHLWFVTIHPYEDGNGRIARAVADLALARDERSGRRFFSMSGEINQSKGKYYDILESTQRGTLDITAWLSWFLDAYARAIARARGVAEDVLRSDAFWRKHSNVAFSERQRRVLDRYMHQFEGKLTTNKWAALTKTSPATATRDIADLIDKGVLVQNPGGSKNTSFTLVGFDSIT
jgi:Fic family protein